MGAKTALLSVVAACVRVTLRVTSAVVMLLCTSINDTFLLQFIERFWRRRGRSHRIPNASWEIIVENLTRQSVPELRADTLEAADQVMTLPAVQTRGTGTFIQSVVFTVRSCGSSLTCARVAAIRRSAYAVVLARGTVAQKRGVLA